MDSPPDETGRPRPAPGSFTAKGLAEEESPHPAADEAERGSSEPRAAEPSSEATPTPSAETGPSTLRRWMPRIAVAIVVIASVASAIVSYAHGTQWKERAEQAAAYAEKETARADQAEELLAGSEEDVRDLEGRLAAVASAKEAARDEAESVSVERDQFLALSAVAAQTAQELDVCVNSLYRGLNEAISMWNTAISTGYFSDPTYLNGVLNVVDRNCSAAQQSNAELRRIVSGLVGS